MSGPCCGDLGNVERFRIFAASPEIDRLEDVRFVQCVPPADGDGDGIDPAQVKRIQGGAAAISRLSVLPPSTGEEGGQC